MNLAEVAWLAAAFTTGYVAWLHALLFYTFSNLKAHDDSAANLRRCRSWAACIISTFGFEFWLGTAVRLSPRRNPTQFKPVLQHDYGFFRPATQLR
jgi:hypothetical protein